MEESIILKDLFKIDDNHSKIRGIVVVKDSDGKIICSRENMIVKTGRQAIFNGTNFNVNRVEDSPFIAVYGDNDKIVTANDTTLNIMKDRDNPPHRLNITLYEAKPEELYIHLRLESQKVIDKTECNCIGLTLKNNGEPGNLFSRVVFPTRYVSQNTTLIFDYYIYF